MLKPVLLNFKGWGTLILKKITASKQLTKIILYQLSPRQFSSDYTFKHSFWCPILWVCLGTKQKICEAKTAERGSQHLEFQLGTTYCICKCNDLLLKFNDTSKNHFYIIAYASSPAIMAQSPTIKKKN